MKNSEEMVVSSFAFIFMSVASVAALFLTSEDETPPQVYIPPTTSIATPMPTGRTFNHLYQTPQDTFEDIDPRVLDRQMQEWVDQQKLQRNPVRFAIEKMWEY